MRSGSRDDGLGPPPLPIEHVGMARTVGEDPTRPARHPALLDTAPVEAGGDLAGPARTTRVDETQLALGVDSLDLQLVIWARAGD